MEKILKKLDANTAVSILNDGGWWNWLSDDLPEDEKEKLMSALEYAELQILRMDMTTKRVIKGEHRAGICPCCGGELHYASPEGYYDGDPNEPYSVWDWTCNHCGASGEERQKWKPDVINNVNVLVAVDGITHCNVEEADGKEVEFITV